MSTPTPNQLTFLKDLLVKRDLSKASEDRVARLWEAIRAVEDGRHYPVPLTREKASECISWLVDQPKLKESPAAVVSLQNDTTTPEVPAGYYAVENEEGRLMFYTVDRPTEGRWRGYVFVKVWASDEKHPIRNQTTRMQILQRIMDAGWEKCAARFGQEIGRCGVCGRTLTDETSRAIGIGPICREGGGW